MSEKAEIEAAMNHFARSRIALNAKVLAVEYNGESNVWVGITGGAAGEHKLVARKQADGSWQVSKYLGSITPKRKS